MLLSLTGFFVGVTPCTLNLNEIDAVEMSLRASNDVVRKICSEAEMSVVA